MANFPGSIFSPTTLTANSPRATPTSPSAIMNAVEAEIVAIETALGINLSNINAAVKVLTGITADSGTTDNATSINNQLTALGNAGGGTAWLPAATNYYGVKSDINVPQSVRLRSFATYLDKSEPGSLPANGAWTGGVIGPCASGNSFTNGVVCLNGMSSAIEHLTVLGGSGASRVAANAIFINNSGCHIVECTGWGGSTSCLNSSASSNDALVVNSQFDNNIVTPVGSPDTTGTTLIVNGPDWAILGTRFINGTSSFQAGDCQNVGNHFSNANSTGGFNVISNTGQGNVFVNCTFDDGNTSPTIGGMLRRDSGPVTLTGCNFLNKNPTAPSWPVLVDNEASPVSGFNVSGCSVPRLGTGPGFTNLILFNHGSNPYTMVNGVLVGTAAITITSGSTIALYGGSGSPLPGVSRSVIHAGVLQAEHP